MNSLPMQPNGKSFLSSAFFDAVTVKVHAKYDSTLNKIVCYTYKVKRTISGNASLAKANCIGW